LGVYDEGQGVSLLAGEKCLSSGIDLPERLKKPVGIPTVATNGVHKITHTLGVSDTGTSPSPKGTLSHPSLNVHVKTVLVSLQAFYSMRHPYCIDVVKVLPAPIGVGKQEHDFNR
jgi:hypothetical protein